jgi:hypothetical protein
VSHSPRAIIRYSLAYFFPEPRIPDRPFEEVIRGRRSRRNFTGGSLRLSTLGSLLFGAIGETGQFVTGYDGDSPVTGSLRSIPSAGALHPTRIFTVILQEGELPRGVYNYDVQGHALELVRSLGDSEFGPLFEAFPIRPLVDIEEASAMFFVSSMPIIEKIISPQIVPVRPWNEAESDLLRELMPELQENGIIEPNLETATKDG